MVWSGATRPARAPPLDGHVAERHAAFHRQILDRLAGVFDDAAGAAGGADRADDGKREVLGDHPRRQRAVDGDPHVPGRALDQRLGGKNVLDLGSADAEGEAAEGAVRRGVGIAAGHCEPGQGEALLRADDVHDTLADVVELDIGQAERLGVFL